MIYIYIYIYIEVHIQQVKSKADAAGALYGRSFAPVPVSVCENAFTFSYLFEPKCLIFL